MTHNIVAEFSCSVWKKSEEERASSLGFNVGDFKVYPVINDSIFSEEYNETLDSATILLSQIKKEDRLSNINPYDYVRVYDTSSAFDPDTGRYDFDKIYLLDNYTEKENNIKEHIFGYTINLMSETKLLEKIQCPDLTITHEVDENGNITKKPIWHHIKKYMDLYVPKIKFSTGEYWSYQPLIKQPFTYTSDNTSMLFNVSNFVLQGDEYEINLTSNAISSEIDLDFIENINFVINSTPDLLWGEKTLTFDRTQRRFNFHGLVQDFPMRSLTAQGQFEEQDFVQYGDEYEIYLVVDTLGNDTLSSPMIIDSFSVDSTLIWSTQEVTYDPDTKQIIFHGISNSKDYGTVYVNYRAKKVNGTITVSFDYIDAENNDFCQRFKMTSADLGFSKPTLRQLLTTLMLQAGCIPVIKNRMLSYLDFQASTHDFGDGDYTVGNTVNYIERSLSSDSFVNQLINTSNQVLDSGNEVVCEALCFRDRSNVFLRQQQNLFLETKLPIYKVNNFAINAYVKADVDINLISNSRISNEINGTQWQWSISFEKTSGRVSVKMGLSVIDQDNHYETSLIIKGKASFFKSGVSEPQIVDINDQLLTSTFNPLTDGIYEFNLEDNTYDTFYFYGQISHFDPQELYVGRVYDIFACNFSGSPDVLTLYKQDITPLLVENSIRQNLSADFQDMEAQTERSLTSNNIETLARYIYGTVGYSIGSKQISGFSEVYNKGSQTWLGWIEVNKTYIENIWTFITRYYHSSIALAVMKQYGNFPIIKNYVYDFNYETGEPGSVVSGGDSVNFVFNDANPYNPLETSPVPSLASNVNFVWLWFDIKYQPLNSFNIAYTKTIEEVEIPLQQYDSNDSGLVDFDRLSTHEQEQVDRIGNEVLNINQRTTNPNQIQTFNNGPLVFMDDTNRSGDIDGEDNGVKYIIFKTSLAVGNNCYKVNYVGSKDAVLKDYFTSIRTKYRAYQYVDYNQSTLRKERDTFFVRISEDDWYNGDDKVFFGAFTYGNSQLYVQQRKMACLLGNWELGGLLDYDDFAYKNSVKNSILGTSTTVVKNDVSIVTTKNFFALIYEEYDNVSGGSYIDLENMIYCLAATGLGGVPQTWQIWEREYNRSHIVSYCSELKFSKTFSSYIDTDNVSWGEISGNYQQIANLPMLSQKYLDLYDSSNDKVVLSIVDNNRDTQNSLNPDSKRRTFHKDGAERINHTVQFNYYTKSKNIIWTENFFRLNCVSGSHYNALVFVNLEGKDFELSNEPHKPNMDEEMEVSENVISINDGSAEHTNPYILINWNLIPDITQFKLIAKSLSKYQYFNNDVIAFKKGDSDTQKFYITINDTKTDYVLAEKNGILYRRYVVSKNTLSRTVENSPDIYDEEE